MISTPQFVGASCAGADPEAWFPPAHSFTRDNRRAVQICQRCPAVTECAEYALRVNVEGIWGGMTDTERQKIRRQAGIRPIALTVTTHFVNQRGTAA